MIYLAGSLRNQNIITIANELQVATGQQVFADWFAAGPEADDHWKAYYEARGCNYRDALREPASVNVYNFDKKHIDACDAMVLVLPAGKSGHLELGYAIGSGKPGYILLDGSADRWDVMYQFATGVSDNLMEIAEHITLMGMSEQERAEYKLATHLRAQTKKYCL